MKRSILSTIIFIYSIVNLLSCSRTPNVNVSFLNKTEVEVSNNGKENFFLRVDNGGFYCDIESIMPGEKKILKINDFKKYETGDTCNKKSFDSNIQVSMKLNDGTYKNILIKEYVPICEDPSGLYFKGDAFFNLKFYKYSKLGKYKSYSNIGYGSEGSVLSDGTYTFSKDNNEIILTTDANLIWKGIYDGVSLKLERMTEVKNSMAPKYLTLYPFYGTVKEENLLPDEKTADYETLFLWGLAQNYSEDEAAEEYAKVYRWEDYKKYKNDEFVWHDLFPQIKNEYLNKIKNLNNKFSMRFDWNFGDYDFEKESFSIEFVKNKFNNPSFGEESISIEECRVYNEIEDNKSLGLAYLEEKYDDFSVSVPLQLEGGGFFSSYRPIKFDLPMPKAEAQKFLESRKNENGKYDKSVFVIVYYEIPKYSPNPKITYTNKVIGQFYKIMVYDSRENMKKLRSAELK